MRRELVATISSKGQLILPREVREHLGIRTLDRVAFVIEDSGAVIVRTPHEPDLSALRGAAGMLPQPLTDEEIADIVAEERAAEYRRSLDSTDADRGARPILTRMSSSASSPAITPTNKPDRTHCSNACSAVN